VRVEGGWLARGGHRCARQRGSAQAAMTQRVGGRGAGGAFPPRIHLQPQETSLGLCEPPQGTSSSSRTARLEDLAVSLGGKQSSLEKRETEHRSAVEADKKAMSGCE
jgi:hypothetical protein